MSILEQFKELTPEEIILIETTLETSIIIGKKRVAEFNEHYNSFEGLDTSVLFDRELLEEQKKAFDVYSKNLKSFKIILEKIKPLKQLVNNE